MVLWNSRQEFPSVEVIVEGAEEELQQSFPPIEAAVMVQEVPAPCTGPWSK